MSLAEASEARKARLLALRKRKAGESDGLSPVTLAGRNFDAETRTLKKHARTDDEDMEDTVEKRVEGVAEQIIAEDEARRAQELDLFNIAPKRVNWDLKRNTQRKLATLDRKMQEAIHTLIRQRLAAQKGQDGDVVGAMRAQELADRQDDASSDEDE